MNDDTNLHPWIEPELEARLTALVLGEASDFERDELERLVADRPELGLYRKRLEAMHRMLREVAKGESGEAVGGWRLAVDRRDKLLAQLSCSPAIAETAMPPVAQRGPWTISPRFLAVAATIVFVGLMLGLMFPASTGALRSKGAKIQWDDDAYANETYGHDRERMRRAVDEGWESSTPANASVMVGDEAQELAPTSAPPAPPAEPMVVTRSGQIGALNGTVAIGAGGDIALGVDPNLPAVVSVTTSGVSSTNVRVGGDFDGRDDGSRSLAAKPVTSTLGGENTYTGGMEISAGGGALAITSPKPVAAAPDADPPVADPEVQLKKQGADSLALNGGTVDLGLSEEIVEFDGFIDHKQKTDAPQSAPSAGGNLNFTGDLQVNGGVEAKVNAAKESRSFGSGGMIAGVSGQEGREGFGFESPAKLDALSRSAGSGVAAGQEGDVSRMGRSMAVEESLAQGLDLADTSRTKDQVIRSSASPTYDIAHRIDKLKTIIIPSVEFNDTPLRDALEFLQERSVELDLGETDPARKGIQIVADTALLQGGEREAAETEANKSGGFGFEPNEGSAGDTRISLRLTNVPLDEALRYTTSLAQLKYKVEPNAVRIVPLSTPDADLFTNVYTVPPTFLSVGDAAAAGGGSAGAAEPFANPVSAGGGPSPGGRTTAKQILESAGISFPEGASAIYNAETSQLIVRNTPDQTELVEAFVDSVAGSEENEGEHLFTRHFLGGAESLRGFDYRDVGQRSDVDKSVQDILALTPQLNQQTKAGEVVWENLQESAAAGGGLRSGEAPISAETIDDLIQQASDASNKAGNTIDAQQVFSMAGVLVDPQFVEVRRRLETRQSTPAALDETSPSAEPFSTFSLHVSDVSFQLAKSSLASGKWPEAEKIRIEEFVNAFDYGDPVPSMGERVACRIDQGAHPFLQQRNLVRIALRTAEAGRSSGTPLRLTLLLDSSGSMERPDRRATLTRAVATLAGLLGENDRITLVSFARQPRLVADAVAGNEAMQLAETVAALPSEGGTNLEAALELAFEKAREHQEANAQNRIVLLTDGAANLGDAKAESLGARVEMMREAGIAFDAAGFGAEGLNDEILEALTRKGDGRYYLLDRPEDAGEAFAEQIAGALRPAAKNVKVQVEFNPDRVKSYKLLGFEKHRLATEDFRNDAVDAAELAAAEAGVAVYQVEPDPAGEGDLGSVSVRFRDLESGEMIERRWALPHLAAAPAPQRGGNAILLATVASQFAAKLAGGPLGDVVDLGELARLAATLPDSPRVDELRTMIEQARGLEGDR